MLELPYAPRWSLRKVSATIQITFMLTSPVHHRRVAKLSVMPTGTDVTPDGCALLSCRRQRYSLLLVERHPDVSPARRFPARPAVLGVMTGSVVSPRSLEGDLLRPVPPLRGPAHH